MRVLSRPLQKRQVRYLACKREKKINLLSLTVRKSGRKSLYLSLMQLYISLSLFRAFFSMKTVLFTQSPMLHLQILFRLMHIVTNNSKRYIPRLLLSILFYYIKTILRAHRHSKKLEISIFDNKLKRCFYQYCQILINFICLEFRSLSR